MKRSLMIPVVLTFCLTISACTSQPTESDSQTAASAANETPAAVESYPVPTVDMSAYPAYSSEAVEAYPAAASDGEAAYPAANGETYTDPFAYCAAVGTIDTPDARYTGDQVPDTVIQGYLTAADLEDTTEPEDTLQQTTIWRCMNSQVYACNYGANLPCDSKADTNTTPTTEMTDYCTENPDAETIPASVTGHATVYNWHCTGTAPEALEQVSQVDDAGYLASIWYAIQASQ